MDYHPKTRFGAANIGITYISPIDTRHICIIFDPSSTWLVGAATRQPFASSCSSRQLASSQINHFNARPLARLGAAHVFQPSEPGSNSIDPMSSVHTYLYKYSIYISLSSPTAGQDVCALSSQYSNIYPHRVFHNFSYIFLFQTYHYQ